MAESQLSEDVAHEEADQIVTILDSLTDEVPTMELPILPPETAETPRPTVEIIPE